MSANLVFLVHLICTWYLVGLIWTIQMVHYSLFDRIGENTFVRYEAEHVRRMAPIAGPQMILELATAIVLVFAAPAGLPRWAALLGLLAVVVIWISTFLIQVPCHNRLSQGFNRADYQWLVSSNWVRTLLWSGRGILLAYFAARLIAD